MEVPTKGFTRCVLRSHAGGVERTQYRLRLMWGVWLQISVASAASIAKMPHRARMTLHDLYVQP